MNEDSYIGIDIGGTKILALVASGNGVIHGSAIRKTPPHGSPKQLIETMGKTAREAADSVNIDMESISAVGIAAAGAVNSIKGTIVYSPHLPSMAHTPVCSMISEALNQEAFIGNDANLAALGEQYFGAGKNISNFVFITISTGIGGGIIMDGQLRTGNSGFAGEIGHMTVDANGPYGLSTTPGAWESLCSGSALARIAKEEIEKGRSTSLNHSNQTSALQEITAEKIFLAARAGDALAIEIIDEAIKYLGTGLTSIVNLLSPEAIIIGGGLSNEWDSYISPAITYMRDQSYAGIGHSVNIVPAALGANAGALGAIVIASQSSNRLAKF